MQRAHTHARRSGKLLLSQPRSPPTIPQQRRDPRHWPDLAHSPDSPLLPMDRVHPRFKRQQRSANPTISADDYIARNVPASQGTL